MSADGPPPKYYPPAPPQAQNMMVGIGPIIADVITDFYPMQVTCSHCHQQVVTEVQYVNGTMVWIMGFFMCFLFFPLMCLPCCTNRWKDAEHYCPSCKALIRIKKRRYI